MKIKVSFEIDVGDNATSDEIQKWLEYELGSTGGLSTNNPMSDVDIKDFNIKQVDVDWHP